MLTRTAALLLAANFTAFSAAAAEVHAVFKSNDRGQSWTRSDAGLPGRARLNAFGLADGVLFAGTDVGLFSSRDAATSWQPASGPAMSSGRIISLACGGGKVLAGTDGNGLLVSSDRGASWALDRTFPSPKVRCLLAHDGKVYAGTEAHGVFVTSEVGKRWIRLGTGLPPQAQVFALSAVNGRMFAALYGRGLYTWDESDLAWTRSGSVTPLTLAGIHDTLIAGHNPGGLSWSRDSGASWSKGLPEAHADGALGLFRFDDSGELAPEAPVWEIASDGRLLFAGAAAHIYYSADCGRRWTRARRGLPEESPGIAFLLTSDFVLAATLIRGGDGEGSDGAARGLPPSGGSRTAPWDPSGASLGAPSVPASPDISCLFVARRSESPAGKTSEAIRSRAV